MSSAPPLREPSERPRAVLLAVRLPDVSEGAFAASLTELERLGDTLGLRVVGRVTQKRPKLSAASVVGTGKLKQLGSWTGGSGVIPTYAPPGKRPAPDAEPEDLDRQEAADAEPETEPEPEAESETEPEAEPESAAEGGASVVLVDHDLSPSQMRNLEKATGVEVLDRSMVIVSIFKRHARTREAKLQVEIAQLSYLAPRLREAGAGKDRQRGGIGGRGAGESALELDRRKIRDRITELREELVIVQREAETRRSRRSGNQTSSVALIGYTNAGKSSWMRALTGDSVYVADQLFATLDTTVRILKPETKPRILVCDTVGFIDKLPHDLVASFRSTLAEAADADLLLHLVDGSDPAFRDQLAVTLRVLTEIGAAGQPRWLISNKADRLGAEDSAAIAREYPAAQIVSARRPEDVQRLHAEIVGFFERDMQEAEFVIPYERQRHVGLLHERGLVLEEHYDERGARVRVRAPESILASLRRELND